MPTKLMTAKEVAAILCVTVPYVYVLCRKREIPCLRIGHYWRFDNEAIRAWLQGALRQDE
jgi:excisionase family DNA binding protein